MRYATQAKSLYVAQADYIHYSVLHPTEPANYTDSCNAFNNIYNYNLEEYKTNAR